MSDRPSACVPPPTTYTPKLRPQSTSKHRDRDSRDRHSRGRPSYQSNTFQRNRSDHETLPKQQPEDRFHKNKDDDYFACVQDEEEEDEAAGFEPKRNIDTATLVQPDDDDEDDPLDAYMKSLESGTSESKEDLTSPKRNSRSLSQEASGTESERGRGVRLDIDDSDDIEESYYNFVNERKCQSDNQEEDERQDLVEYDDDGNIISIRKVKRDVEPLPHFDHSNVNYEPFQRNLYAEHEDISKLTPEQSDALRSKLEIKVSGNFAPRPVCSFAHFKFDERLMRVIRRSEYFQPTPIQAQAIPAALSGRNIIGIAVTGSGKTAAYIWPMIVHILRQPNLKAGDGPIGLILVPTRELAQQVYGEAKKFSSSYKLKVICAYGGGSKYEQARDLEDGAEIVVATPGRLIDLVKSNSTNLKRVTYLVLDEADTFFKMGFEAQVRSICDYVRPDRQTLLFSATFKHEVELLARSVTDDPVKIVQKTSGEANEDVSQHVVVLPSVDKKWNWLTSRLVEFTTSGSVLIFVTRIVNCNELHENLKATNRDTLLLHGDMEQAERNRVITAFKRKEKDIMIATDVAARGLDISHIRTVINYDVARDIDTHIHRVGRTGRAGMKGDAYTLLSTDRDKEFAGHLVKNLESAKQSVSSELMRLAMQSYNFRKTRDRQSRHTKDSDSNSNHSSSYKRSSHNNRGYRDQNGGDKSKDLRYFNERESSSRHSLSFYGVDKISTTDSSSSYQSISNREATTSHFERDRYMNQTDKKRTKWR